jgi:hypothetical protein
MFERLTKQGWRCLLFALILLAQAGARADNLTTVRAGSLPALPAAEAVTRVMAVDSRLVALTAQDSWLLDETGKAWVRAPWKADGQIVRSAVRGKETLLLLDGAGQGADRVASLCSSRSTGSSSSSTWPMLGIGLYFYLREKRQSTADFFVGGRSIPFWAAGVSLYAANTSSISYIAIPAKAFETNWQYMTNNLVAVVALMFVAVWIVPLLRRLDLMSVFSLPRNALPPGHPHAGQRPLHPGAARQPHERDPVTCPRWRSPPSPASTVTWSILLMGGFTICYTALGGMKAVVWTDIVQLVVKMGGALFAIGFIVWSLNGGMAEFVRTAAAEDKTRLFDFSFDLTKATVWGFHVPGAVRRGADLPQGPGADAAHAVHQVNARKPAARSGRSRPS